MTVEQSRATFAAAVYQPDTGDRMALLKFVNKLRSNNTAVGGVLQEAIYDPQGEIAGLNAIDVATGHRSPITNQTESSDSCGLDVSLLVETSSIIRAAIRDNLELIVIEKFGELEQKGEGLMDEIMQTMIEGIPLLISVPQAALPIWQERSGELGSVLDFNEAAFESWWQGVNQQGFSKQQTT